MAEETGFDPELFNDFASSVSAEPDEPDETPELPDLEEPREIPSVEPEAVPVEPTPEPVSAEGEEDFDYSTPLNPREKALLARLEEKTGETIELRTPTATESARSTIPPEEVNFLEGLDLDEVFSSPENFNKLLLSVYNKGLERASSLAAENVMQTLPATISTFVTQHADRVRMVDDFYSANPDLIEVKRTVAAIANEISADHPEYTLQKVFDETATKTREVLKMKARPPRVNTPAKGGQNTRRTVVPAQSGRSAQRFTEPELDGLAKEVNDLLVDV